MKVLFILVCFEESFILRVFGENSKLYLRVIRRYNLVPRSRDEQVTPVLGMGDLLKVRFLTGETTGFGSTLKELRMNSTGLWIDMFGKFLNK